MKVLIIIIGFLLMHLHLHSQIMVGYRNDFDDGSTQGWKEGGASPNQPYIILTGGPSGTADAFLRNASSGQGGPGGKCVMFNAAQAWTGNYAMASVNTIMLYARNSGLAPLHLRLAFNGAGGVICSKEAIVVETDSIWHLLRFRLDTHEMVSLTQNGNIQATLEGVNEIRILSGVEPSYTGDQALLSMDIDVVEATLTTQVPTPSGHQKPCEFSIVPNPVERQFILQDACEPSEEKQITIYDLNGRKRMIMGSIFPGVPTDLPKKLDPGIYLMVIHGYNPLLFSKN